MMTTTSNEMQPQEKIEADEARRPPMPAEELDNIVARILEKASQPMPIPQIERRVADETFGAADTFDVQRSVQRLVAAGKAEVTARLHVKARPKSTAS